jgi:hypothetical protein
VQQWHVDYQQELPGRVITTLSYVGSKGTHLGRRSDLNQIPQFQQNQNPYLPGEPIGPDDCSTGTTPSGAVIPGFTPGSPDLDPTQQTPGTIGVNMYVACGADPNFFRPFLGYATIRRQDNAASSIYNGFQASLRRTVGRVQLSASYTWSHSIDDASSGSDGSFVDSYNLALNRASSNFDQRHVFTLSYIYDLPFFRNPGLTHTLLGGWQWSGITTVQTGTPYSVTNAGADSVPGDNAGVANGVGTGSWPDLIGDPNAVPAGSGAAGGFGPLFSNPAAFAAPRGLTFGDAGRNIARNPRQTNFDMGLYKHFPIHESVSLEFRAEAFNVFNHTQWGYIAGDAGSAGGNSGISSFSNGASCYEGPNNTACSSEGFLRPAGAHNARILQLALKLIF